MIKFILLVNSQGLVRITKYYQNIGTTERKLLESNIIKLCLTRDAKQSTILEYEDYTIVFRRYVSLMFIAGITKEENELAIYELFQHIAETLNKYFGKISELHILYNMDKVHIIMDEMVVNGHIAETCQPRILAPLQLMTSATR